MANTSSAEKSIRQTRTRTKRNRANKTRVRVLRKTALAAVASGDSAKAQKAYDKFASAADKAAKTNTIHKNTASRLKSRMAARLKSLAK
jgi:small subunit ribosomal protein S20